MFFTDGDLNWRHNVSGFSMLNPWVASLFAFGILLSLIIILKGFKKIIFRQPCSENFFKHFLLMLWFFGMLAPELLTAEAIPHGLRAIGVFSIIFFWPALAVDFFWKKAKIFSSKN